MGSMPAATSDKWSIAQHISNSSKLHDHYDVPAEHNVTDDIYVKHGQKLKDVKKGVSRSVGELDPLEGLIFVDAVQRLGIDHHFQEEIEAILHRNYMEFNSTTIVYNCKHLYLVSLCFRLLRQQGYLLSSDVFNNFKDKDGKFIAQLSKDLRGLMALYEASQLSIEGEDILDEAVKFSNEHLNLWMTNLDHLQASTIANTLQHPYQKSLGRFMAKNFIRDFKGPNGWEDELKELAKMEFNVVQSIHQEEVKRVSKWWEDLGLAKELMFARNQPLKWYAWPMAILTDPSLSDQRIQLTKPISLVYIIDDVFDVYGTLDQLTLFTEAIHKWDFDVVDDLPDYMKKCFKAVHDITEEMSYNVYKDHGWNPIDLLREMWASLCSAFLVEAKWFASGDCSKTEEYLKNGIVSSGVPLVLVHLYFLLGNGTDKESANIVRDNQGMLSSVATILRLWDDLGSAEDENQDGHDGSYVECYMKEHQGSSVETAREHVMHTISDAWKRLNKECLSPNPFSASFTKACLNVARIVPLMYSYDNDHCLPVLQELIKSMLFEVLQ